MVKAFQKPVGSGLPRKESRQGVGGSEDSKQPGGCSADGVWGWSGQNCHHP